MFILEVQKRCDNDMVREAIEKGYQVKFSFLILFNSKMF